MTLSAPEPYLGPAPTGWAPTGHRHWWRQSRGSHWKVKVSGAVTDGSALSLAHCQGDAGSAEGATPMVHSELTGCLQEKGRQKVLVEPDQAWQSRQEKERQRRELLQFLRKQWDQKYSSVLRQLCTALCAHRAPLSHSNIEMSSQGDWIQKSQHDMEVRKWTHKEQ